MGNTESIVVTGAASGLGAAIVERLAAAGRDTIGVDLHDSEVVADLGTPEGRSHAVAAIRQRAGSTLAGVVSCAGASPIHPDPAAVISINYFGAMAMLDELLPLLEAGTRAAAVAISSIGAAAGPHDDALVEMVLAGDEDAARIAANDGTEYRSAIAYNAAKVGVAKGVRSRAAEWARAGVRLNAVAPGRMETPMLDGLMADPVIEAGVGLLPEGIRLSATADDIAATVVFLLGADASFVHGQVLFADGGVEAQLRPDDF